MHRLLIALCLSLAAWPQSGPTTAPGWFQLGESRLKEKNYAGAIEAYAEAEKLGYTPRSARFRSAVAAAASGDKTAAFRHHDLAIDAGFAAWPALLNDPAFAPWKQSAEFKERVERAHHPCRNVKAYGKLDFWVGKWDVVSNDESRAKAGFNLIEKALDGCAVIENWRDLGGTEGKSLFSYNIITGKWKQFWVQGNADYKEKDLVEEFPDGGVRFQGVLAAPGGRVIHDRTTLTPMKDGSVRQHIEQSLDGKAWQTVFDALYIRAR